MAFVWNAFDTLAINFKLNVRNSTFMVIGDSNLDVTYYSYVTSRKYIVHVLFKVHFNLS